MEDAHVEREDLRVDGPGAHGGQDDPELEVGREDGAEQRQAVHELRQGRAAREDPPARERQADREDDHVGGDELYRLGVARGGTPGAGHDGSEHDHEVGRDEPVLERQLARKRADPGGVATERPGGCFTLQEVLGHARRQTDVTPSSCEGQ